MDKGCCGTDAVRSDSLRDLLLAKLQPGEYTSSDNISSPAKWKRLHKDTIEFYDRAEGDLYVVRYGRDPIVNFVSRLDDIFRRSDFKGMRALDLACGPGQYARLLQERGFNVELYDASAKMLKYATKALGKRHPPNPRDYFDLAQHCRREEFDLVFASAMMVHVPSRFARAFYDEFYRILKPCGVLFVNFKIGDHSLVSLGRRYFQYYRDRHIPKDMLEAAGFRIVEVIERTNERTLQNTPRDIRWVNFFCVKNTGSKGKVDSTPHPLSLVGKKIQVTFWPGFDAELDAEDIAARSLSVKGTSFDQPLRFLEIYNDLTKVAEGRDETALTYDDVKRRFFPRLAWQDVDLNPTLEQPPFSWKDGDAQKLCVSFTYNANAFYRILKNLSALGKVPEQQVGQLLDRACRTLGRVYQAGGGHVIRNINNNWNMYLISRVIEDLVGKDIYDSEVQELSVTQRSLKTALDIAPGFAQCSVFDKIGLSLGMGVAFVEQRLQRKEGMKQIVESAEAVAYDYFGKDIAIDDRARMLMMISNASSRERGYTLAAVLDDATETVVDLLWMQDIMKQFPHFRVNLLVNTAQISINFSSHMLDAVLASPCFYELSARLNKQFFVTTLYCPFISFQSTYLPPHARRVIADADAVFVKGANFFETCQIPEKDAFHAFIVFGPVSRAYSGLLDYDAVFAFIPAGSPGYVHNAKGEDIVTLKEIIRRRDACEFIED